MNQCVPSWDLDYEYPNFPSHSTSLSLTPDVPTYNSLPSPRLGNEVAELTWQNGHLSMHGLGQPRAPNSNIWDKPTGDTLEAIVHQSSFPHHKFPLAATANELVPWFNHHKSVLASTTSGTTPVTASITGVMDALVPCTNNNLAEGSYRRVMDSDFDTRVESCSGANVTVDKVRAVRVIVPEWSSCPDNSVTESANTRQVTVDTYEKNSMASPENTSSGKHGIGDDYDSACHSRAERDNVQEKGKKKANGKLSASTKRNRAAAVHNQCERKRRDKINQRMKTLQKLVPNSSKTDKASMLDEVIDYLKELQAQVNMMSRMNMSRMMLPYAMQQQQQQQQQLQMSMMAPMMGMGMGMGMGHVMDMTTGMTCRPNMAAFTPAIVHPAFMPPMNSWDGVSVDHRLHSTVPPSVMHDPMSTFLAACQSQPMTMDAYSRMAAFYQQLHQNSGSGAMN